METNETIRNLQLAAQYAVGSATLFSQITTSRPTKEQTHVQTRAIAQLRAAEKILTKLKNT